LGVEQYPKQLLPPTLLSGPALLYEEKKTQKKWSFLQEEKKARKKQKPSVVQFLKEEDAYTRKSVQRALESRPEVGVSVAHQAESLEMIAHSLRATQPEVRANGLLAFSLMKTPCHDFRPLANRVSTIVGHLTDRNDIVQSAASKALTAILTTGSAHEVDAIIDCLRHDDSRVRCSVLKCLRTPHCNRLSQETNPSALRAVKHVLKDVDADVRASAVCTLGALASKGEVPVLLTTLTCLSDSNSQVRAAALRALGRLAHKGHIGVIAAASEHLHDEDPEVRAAALQALGVVAEKGDMCLRDLMLGHLMDGHSLVRDAAMRSLSKVSVAGDTKVRQAIQERLNDEDEHVRFSAKYVMVYLTSKTD